MEIENKLKELLVPVFGLSSAEEIKSENSLVLDLGADSLDFVEIAYVIESNFGVNIKTNQIIVGGANISDEELFEENILTVKGAELINKNFTENRYKAGQTRRDLFNSITVTDLANIIKAKIKA